MPGALTNFRASDFLLSSDLLSDSEATSPASTQLEEEPCDSPRTSPSKYLRLRRSSRLRGSSQRKGSSQDLLAGLGSSLGLRCEDGAGSSPQQQLGAKLQPLAGGPSPTLQPAGLLGDWAPGDWVEDSCRDVCEFSPPAALEPAQPGTTEGTEAAQDAGRSSVEPSGIEQPAAAGAPLDGGVPSGAESKQEEQLLCTPCPRHATSSERECCTPGSAQQHSLSTPLGRLLTTDSEAPSTAGQRNQRLLQQVDFLTAKLAAEAESRRALQVQLAEQRREAERAQQQLENSFEAKLSELQQQLHEAAAMQGGALRERILSGDGDVRLSGGEASKLRKELADQEMLLRAYQAENELAAQRIKSMQLQHKQEVEVAREEAARLQQQLAAQAAALPATPQAGIEAGRLQQILSLESQLEALRAAGEEREAELRQQLAAAKSDKQQLEGRLEQLNAHGTQAQALVAHQFEMQLQTLRIHAADTQAKLQWYMEHHELLKSNEELVQQQARTIMQLEQQLLSPSPERPASCRRLADLEQENTELKAQLAAVRVATNGTGPALAAALQQRILQLEATAAQQEADSDRRLKSARQECDKLRSEAAKRASVHAATKARLKELEQQVEEVRSAARKKVQTLELKLKAAEAKAVHSSGVKDGVFKPSAKLPQPPHAATSAASPHSDMPVPQREQQRMKKLEAELARREAELASLHKRAAAADDLVNQAAEREQSMAATMRSLQQSLSELGAANEALRAQVKEAQERQATSREREARMRELECQMEAAELALAAARQAHAEAQERAAALKASHQAELQAAREQHSRQLEQAVALAAAPWQAKVAAAERAAEELQQRVAVLEAGLSDARASIPWTPKAVEFASLERKMRALEAQQSQREAHWQGLVEEASRRAALQDEAVRQRYEAAMAAKEGQLDTFRRELDGILAAARVLQGQQPMGPADALGLPQQRYL